MVHLQLQMVEEIKVQVAVVPLLQEQLILQVQQVEQEVQVQPLL
jgi:hypothetical protein